MHFVFLSHEIDHQNLNKKKKNFHGKQRNERHVGDVKKKEEEEEKHRGEKKKKKKHREREEEMVFGLPCRD